jgi:hypothetical protein
MAASGASDQGVGGALVPVHCGSNDNIGGCGRLWRPEIVCRKNRPLSSIQFIAVDTSEQFFWGVVDTSDNIFP